MRKIWAAILGILCLIAFWHCSKPPTVKGKGMTLVIVVGGLGADQTGDIVARLETIPSLTVVSAGSWDGYKADIPALYNKETKLVLIGHSFGGETVINACASIPVDALILIDPVAEGWGDMQAPKNVGTILLFYRVSWFGPRTAKINEGPEPILVQGGHNTIPHDAGLIEKIVETVTR